MIGNILNKKHPVKIIDSTFAIFLIFIGAVLISQMHTLIGSYMNYAIDEMTRTHEIIMESKSNQVNKVIFLEDYFSYIFNKKISLEQEIRYNKIIDRAKKTIVFDIHLRAAIATTSLLASYDVIFYQNTQYFPLKPTSIN